MDVKSEQTLDPIAALVEMMRRILSNNDVPNRNYRIWCAEHHNLPGWCWDLHYPEATRR